MVSFQKMMIHYTDVIMTEGASQITSLTIVYSVVNSGGDQRKHQSSASLAFVRGIHRRPANSPRKGTVTRKMFPFDDVIMNNNNNNNDNNMLLCVSAFFRYSKCSKVFPIDYAQCFHNMSSYCTHLWFYNYWHTSWLLHRLMAAPVTVS